MARSVVLWNDYKGSQEVITLENGRLAQETINANLDTWNLAGSSIQQGGTYNGVRIDSANGILVTTTSTLIKLNAALGIEIYNNKSAGTDKRVFYIDTNGNINLSGNINMTGGSINWSGLSGNNPTSDANNTFKEMTGNANIMGMFVNQSGKLVVNANEIKAGKIDAQYVKIGSTSTFDSGYDPTKISVGTFNYVRNGDFSLPLDASPWYVYPGDVTEIVDISGEAAPFKKALHVKNNTAKTGGYSSVPVFSGEEANSMLGKEITVSFWAKYQNVVVGTNSWNYIRMGELVIEGEKADGVTKSYSYLTTLAVSGTNMTWAKYSRTITIPLPAEAVKLTKISFKHMLEGAAGEYWTTGIKMETGNKVTDFLLHPEDTRLLSSLDTASVVAKSKYNRIRYVRDWSAGNSANSVNHWVQLKVMQSGVNLAAGKIPISNGSMTNPEFLTNGNISSSNFVGGATGNVEQYVQIDLGAVYNNIDYIQSWHYYSDSRTYNKTKIEISDNGTDWFPLFDSAVSGTYVETAKGLIATATIGAFAQTVTTKLETMDGQISAKVETKDMITWERIYNVNTATPAILKNADGTDLDKWATYKVTAKVLGTGTDTTAVAYFKSNNGASWTLEKVLELGKDSNHPEFYIDASGNAAIRVYNHTTKYNIAVTHEKTRGNKTEFQMTSDKISLVVKSDNTIDAGAIASSITATSTAIDAIALGINLTGKVTFNAFDTASRNTINGKADASVVTKIASNGLAIKPDFSTFGTATVGSMYLHGFNSATGDAADVDGYVIINGNKQTVVKGVLTPAVTGEGYIMYDKSVSVWYFAQYTGSTGTWKRYNNGKANHNTTFTMNDNQFFVGFVTM